MNSIMFCLKDFYWKTRQNTDEVNTFCSALTCKGKTFKKICDGDKVTLSLREKVMTCQGHCGGHTRRLSPLKSMCPRMYVYVCVCAYAPI